MNIDPMKSGARALADLATGTVLATVDIAAPAERVFRALSDPQELAQWWGSPDTYRAERWEADFRVGGRWRVEGKAAAGQPYSVFGEFLEIRRPRRIVQTWTYDWEKDQPPTKLTYQLDDVPGGTRITVRHEGFASEVGCSSHENGWVGVLQWLENYLEKSVLPGHSTAASDYGGNMIVDVQAVRARHFNPFRLAAYLLVLYAFGHTFGAVIGIPRLGPESDAVVLAMKSVHVQVHGADCTWYGFYRGFGAFVSVYFVFSAFTAWRLGRPNGHDRSTLLPIAWALFASHVAGLIVACVYFFPMPIAFSGAISAVLGFGCVRASRVS